jgi:hypothetical protein
MKSSLASQQKIGHLALLILQGKTDVVDGCRRIVNLRGSLREPESSDPDLLVVVGVVSELDGMPTPEVKHLWDADALARKEVEGRSILEPMKGELLRSCAELSLRWGISH